MVQTRGSKEKETQKHGKEVICLSSDGEEANVSMAAVKKPRRRRRSEVATPGVICLSSSEENAGEPKKVKKRRVKKKGLNEEQENTGLRTRLCSTAVPKNNQDAGLVQTRSEAEHKVGEDHQETLNNERVSKPQLTAMEDHLELPKDEKVPETEEELLINASSACNVVNKDPDNAVLRKFLRGQRYFDPSWKSCYNCGEEGHTSAECVMEKRQKPCFVCGKFGHTAGQCKLVYNCHICKRQGHSAKKCPEKNKLSDEYVFCLKCGNSGHDTLSCSREYDAEDLKEIQCYICKRFGHLCCVDNIDSGPRVISCYNCAQVGHAGLVSSQQQQRPGCIPLIGECPLPHGGNEATASRKLCYKCGEAGHLARGCNRNSKRGEALSPMQKVAKRDGKNIGVKSSPHDLGKSSRKKNKQKKGQHAKNHHVLPNINTQANSWASSTSMNELRLQQYYHHVIYVNSPPHQHSMPFQGTAPNFLRSSYQNGFLPPAFPHQNSIPFQAAPLHFVTNPSQNGFAAPNYGVWHSHFP